MQSRLKSLYSVEGHMLEFLISKLKFCPRLIFFLYLIKLLKPYDNPRFMPFLLDVYCLSIYIYEIKVLTINELPFLSRFLTWYL